VYTVDAGSRKPRAMGKWMQRVAVGLGCHPSRSRQDKDPAASVTSTDDRARLGNGLILAENRGDFCGEERSAITY
jgi:hypothetical protein